MKEASESPFFEKPDIPYLQGINVTIVECYKQLALAEKWNCFDMIFKTYFNRLSNLKMKYVFTALNEMDIIVNRFREKEMKKQASKKQLEIRH